VALILLAVLARNLAELQAAQAVAVYQVVRVRLAMLAVTHLMKVLQVATVRRRTTQAAAVAVRAR
jgi:hypothetical protein